MSKVRRVALSAGLVLAVGAAVAIPSSAAPTTKARSAGNHPHGPSPALRAMLREIDAHRVQSDITKLASFGTRHTLSSQDDPNRGIGAARDWIFDQFQSYAATSGGRMTVAKQSFVQPPGPRNPDPVTVTNLVATLRGTQAESADRVYVVSGHYDSRCTDVLNFTCDAPGADDDASGVATCSSWRASWRSAASTPRSSSWPWRARSRASSARRSSPSRPRRRAWTSRACSPTTSSAARPATRAGATRSRCACSPRACPTTETPAAGRPAPVDRRRERRALAPARALRQGGRRELGHRDARAPRLAPRSLPARRRSDPVPAAGLSGGALHRAGGELRPPAPGRPGGERPAVRRPAAVRRLRLHRARGARQRRGAGQPGVGADGAQGGHDRHDAADQRHDPDVEGQPRARPRGLRGRLARVDRSAVDAQIPVGNVTTLHDPRPLQGQRPGRRARGGPRRLPQPGGVPGTPVRSSATSGWSLRPRGRGTSCPRAGASSR